MLQTNDKPLASFSFIGRYYTLHNNSSLHYNLVLLKSNLKTILRIPSSDYHEFCSYQLKIPTQPTLL